ncbi:MAG: heavy-metal-associated domain-containing protein [Oscillospiraceae bacterium]|nr:heavy-metal-associated domain-containing protein [Oscillospiraceae bacterium]
MKKIFRMEDLDCANCAAKMEAGIKKIDGVTAVTVNFLAQKMILEADDARFDEIVKEAVKAVKKVDPHCEVLVK